MTADPTTIATLVALQAHHRALGTFDQGRSAAHVIDEVEPDWCQHGGSRCVCDEMAERCFGGAS